MYFKEKRDLVRRGDEIYWRTLRLHGPAIGKNKFLPFLTKMRLLLFLLEFRTNIKIIPSSGNFITE